MRDHSQCVSRSPIWDGGEARSSPPGVMTADLAQLFEQYYASLVRMLYRRTGDRDRAEEIAQETFARAVAAPPHNPRPWLFAVALNLVREDGRRAATRGRRLELSAPSSPSRRRRRITRWTAGRARASPRSARPLTSAIAKPCSSGPKVRYEEIAATLGLAKGAIGTTLARARRRLVVAYRAQERARQKERGKHVAS